MTSNTQEIREMLGLPIKIRIEYMNGSHDWLPKASYFDAILYCRHHISYTGGRVRRVEIWDGDSERPIWDHEWDAQSKHAGLWS